MSAIRLRRVSLCELMCWVATAAVFFGVAKAISADAGTVLLACWVVSVVVLRGALGWLVALLLCTAFGAFLGGLFGFLVAQSHHPSPPLADLMCVAIVKGIVLGAAIAGSGIVAGWLIHEVAQAARRIRSPVSCRETPDR